MKHSIRLILLIIPFLFYNSSSIAIAPTYNYNPGESYWIFHYVGDNTYGYPHNPDSIKYLMLDSTFTDTIRGPSGLNTYAGGEEQGDGRHPGLWGAKITLPDSNGLFPLIVEVYLNSRDSAIAYPEIIRIKGNTVDSLGLIAKGQLADTTYKKFTYGTNENQFKADVSDLAKQAEVANLNGWNPETDSTNIYSPNNYKNSITVADIVTETWHKDLSTYTDDSAYGAGYYTKIGGDTSLSIWFMGDTDTLVYVNTVISIDKIGRGQVADTAYKKFTDGTNENQFKANVSALALQDEVKNIDGWNPATDTVHSFASAGIDTLAYYLGMKIGAISYTKYNNDVDTIFIVFGTDTLSNIIFYHPGKYGGAEPDSYKVIAP